MDPLELAALVIAPNLKMPFNWNRVAKAIVDADAAAVLSVQHTGTWFAIDFLTDRPGGGRPTDLREAIGLSGFEPQQVVHAHMGPARRGGPPDHLDIGGPDHLDIVSATGRAVVTVRDPMLAILTRHARHPLLDHSYLVDAFVGMARRDLPVTYLRVDCTEPERRPQLDDIVEALGWDVGEDHLALWSTEWRPSNVSQATPEKRCYTDGKWDKLKAVLGCEIAALLDARPVLVPFLERLGYKELSWWTL